ncbi:hypothetical protein Droror1_Dr00019078 [Drosera rotundifolia]
MAVVPRKMRGKETDQISPERTKVWSEPNNKHQHQMKNSGRRRVVHVVYYLSRNGQLEHPHFMEVPLSAASDGLFLRDVISRLNLLRGKGMASQYSWSSKRSYKNGYVWHDLEEDDFIHPVQGQDYVLKGSQIILQSNPPVSINSETTASSASSSSRKLPDIGKSDDQPVIQAPRSHRRNQSWSSIDLQEYKVYKSDSTGADSTKSAAADASTQTDDRRRRRQSLNKEDETNAGGQEPSTELNTEEISPPASDSSPETLETLMKADGRVILSTVNEEQQQQNDETRTTVSSYCPSGRMKASSVLMSLISCGSTSFRDHGVVQHHHHGLLLVPKPRLSRGGTREGDEVSSCSSSRFGNGKGGEGIEEYYSGSLVMEAKKDEFQGGLKRSSSYNADRSSDISITEEMEGMRAKCIPRKPKAQPAKMLINSEIANSAVNDAQVRTKAVGVE